MSDYYNEIVTRVKAQKVEIYDRIDMDKKNIVKGLGNQTSIDEYLNLKETLEYEYSLLEQYSENNSSNKKVYIVMQSMRNTKNDINKMIEEIQNI
jgi:hypothetical protein